MVQMKSIRKRRNGYVLVDEIKSYAGGATSGAVAAALSLCDGGSGMDAYKEFVYAAMDVIPAAKLGKATVEATKAGAQMWQDYSVESAFFGAFVL